MNTDYLCLAAILLFSSLFYFDIMDSFSLFILNVPFNRKLINQIR